MLDFKRCFLNQPFEKKVRLTNTGNVPACFSVLDQVRNTHTNKCLKVLLDMQFP